MKKEKIPEYKHHELFYDERELIEEYIIKRKIEEDIIKRNRG